MKSSWRVPAEPEADISELAAICGVDEELVKILYSRGFNTPGEITGFIQPSLSDLHAPFLLNDMYDAVVRIRRAITLSEKIAIFSDSDIDGVTSLAIINDLLVKLNIKPFIRYPREREGYGLTCDIIDEFRDNGIDLVITVDSGIRDVREISYGRSAGIDFIITDHHEPDSELPDAVIINPKLETSLYPFKELAGVGVAFKLAHGVLYSYLGSFDVRFILISSLERGYIYSFVKNGVVASRDVAEPGMIERLISESLSAGDYVVFISDSMNELSLRFADDSGITVSDLYRIANTILRKSYKSNGTCIEDLRKLFGISSAADTDGHDIAVKLFLELQMRSSGKILNLLREYVALVAIGTIADIMPVYGENRQLIKYGISVFNSGGGHAGVREILGNNTASSKSISWDVAPLLNTPGRMGLTELTVEFFLTEDKKRIKEIISEIQKLNRERRKIVTEMINRIKECSQCTGNEDGFFFYRDAEIMDGLAGLIANRIAEDIRKPVIIMSGPDPNGCVKGSGRSYGKFNFLSHVEPFSETFERLGGHAQAFGFTIKDDNVETAMEMIKDSIGRGYNYEDSLRIDSILNIAYIDTVFIEKLSLLEPFGKNNEEPVFLSRNVKVLSYRDFGADSSHGKYILQGNIQALGWNMAETMLDFYITGRNLDIVYRLENNQYQGRMYPRIIIIDIDFYD